MIFASTSLVTKQLMVSELDVYFLFSEKILPIFLEDVNQKMFGQNRQKIEIPLIFEWDTPTMSFALVGREKRFCSVQFLFHIRIMCNLEKTYPRSKQR